jgi:hypothetical protein
MWAGLLLAVTAAEGTIPNPAEVAEGEKYLAEYVHELVDFRTNPISREYV